jgi:hypothetical protein
MDLGIEVILKVFSEEGLSELFQMVGNENSDWSDNSIRIYNLKQSYINTIDSVIGYLQGSNQTMARLICSENFLPQASRFSQLEDLDWAFGEMGIQDKAKYLSTLYLEDISDFIKECVDEHFGFSRYAERLGRSANSFDELYDHLDQAPSYIDQLTTQILRESIEVNKPKLVCISVPFPGNLYSALRCGKFIKSNFPEVIVAMGGGFPNTELRDLKDPRVFEFVDFITLDDGELPIEILVSNIVNPLQTNPDYNLYKRTFLLQDGEVLYNNHSLRSDYKQEKLGTPDYSDLPLDKYIHVIEIANSMHSLWSDGRWNKLTMAHGCYWGKCTFCDVSLDYIGNYEPLTAQLLVDRMETIMVQTGETGFHFVDEAAPPALMKELAIEIIKRKLVVSWWTNIRFEKSFTKDLCQLLMASGCIAVSGGLEVASDRLLEVIKKGVTVGQVARVTKNFTEAGIMVHAYLMYGYPTQTIQETIDSLEMVRQMMELGIIRSGFWHQFALTTHSPIGKEPEAYGIIPRFNEIQFANNDVEFEDRTGIDHDLFSNGLKVSLFNYMNGVGFDLPLQHWFEYEIPETGIADDFIQNSISNEDLNSYKNSNKLIYLGTMPNEYKISDDEGTYTKLSFNDKRGEILLVLDHESSQWFVEQLQKATVDNPAVLSFGSFKESYEVLFEDFNLFWNADEVLALRDNLLLVV